MRLEQTHGFFSIFLKAFNPVLKLLILFSQSLFLKLIKLDSRLVVFLEGDASAFLVHQDALVVLVNQIKIRVLQVEHLAEKSIDHRDLLFKF